MIESIEELRNDSPSPMDVHLEPWGAVHTLSPGSVLRIVARSPTEGTLEVVREESHITVFAWPGSTVQAFEGSKLVADCRPPVPDLPKGMSVRRFVKLMFGSEAEGES